MSTIDLTQFHATFYAESFDGLASMETNLLRLEQGSRDPETLDSIFRSIHSIKGASATFGFTAIAQFTHTLETLLDALRKRTIEPDRAIVSLLLECVDCVRRMLSANEQHTAVDAETLADLTARVEAAFSVTSHDTANEPVATPVADQTLHKYSIAVQPSEHFFHGGNDPLNLFRILRTMGELTVTPDLSRLPRLELLEPENCYLSWTLTLVSEVTREQIMEVFDWVFDACEVHIEAEPADEPASIGQAGLAPRTKSDSAPIARATPMQSAYIQVDTDKIDRLINLIGELVITQSMLDELGSGIGAASLPRLTDQLSQLARNTRELQESVMSIRMVPISLVFNRYIRLVRDTSLALDKEIDLVISGEHCELDKSLIEKLVDPFAHLIRNSIDHGIESPAERRGKGKPQRGTIALHAEHKAGAVVVTIRDDGRGLDHASIRAKAIERGLLDPHVNPTTEQIEQFIFVPGFSTASEVSDVSGRGVGLDVVRTNIQSIGGNVEVRSTAGEGTQFTLRLPLTLAILDGLLLSVGNETFVLPLAQILESLRPGSAELNSIAECRRVVRIRDEYIPIFALHELFDIPHAIHEPEQGILVLLEADGSRFALLVDELVGQQQVVMKSLESNYRRTEGMLGATILGNGRVALIVDVSALPRMYARRQAVAA